MTESLLLRAAKHLTSRFLSIVFGSRALVPTSTVPGAAAQIHLIF